jgi:hypothetical protein
LICSPISALWIFFGIKAAGQFTEISEQVEKTTITNAQKQLTYRSMLVSERCMRHHISNLFVRRRMRQLWT